MISERNIWNYLKSKGLSEFAIAGIMGNLYAESGLEPENLQNNFEVTLGMSDHQYTMAVDSYVYDNFVHDAAGYGLAQWTFWSRKQGLLNLARSMEKSVGDLSVQLDFLWSELQEFGLVGKLNECKSVRDASNLMLFEFEKPYDTGTVVQNARANWSQKFYDKYHGTTVISPMPEDPVQPSEPVGNYMYCVIAFSKFTTKQESLNCQKLLKGNSIDSVIMREEI